MDTYEKIISRRTIRKFKQDKIERELLKRLVNAGRLAPSAANLQPLKYLAVDYKKLKEEVFPCLSWAGYIEPEGDPVEGERPVAYIIILADRNINPKPDRDIGASAENISIAAESEGLGCCWIGAFKKKKLHKAMNVPRNLSVELVISLGYPMEEPVAEDIAEGSSIMYYKDEKGKLHVPKRSLADILYFNAFRGK